MKHEVLVVGAALTDLQIAPVPQDIMNRAVTPIESFHLTIGGDAPNEATIISRLGHQVSLMTMIGDDEPGQVVLRHCRENGIDTDAFIIRKDMPTAINVGLVSAEGVRSCITPKNSNLWLYGPEDLNYAALGDGYSILSFASLCTFERIDGQPLCDFFRAAKERGMIICADMNGGMVDYSGRIEEYKETLSYVDYFFPNRGEAAGMTGKTDPEEMADVFLSWGVGHVIVKTGADGCILKSKEEHYIVPAYTKARCVDETGAGDNFAAGFICGLLERKSFLECAQYATAVASICIEHVGTCEGVKNREMVEERLQDYLALSSS
ncbi:MAG: carbohydrate kinase family protein [Lachnospiraceae bacterium]|nr:carbohydrate kinase family protein [Lachnospiraceae bacterium]